MFRKSMLLALTVLMVNACSPLSARPLVDVSVVDRDSGEWLREYRHRADTWVAGTPGNRYSVRLTNTSGERVLVVLSVDGINAVSGQTAHPSQSGYVLGPWESTEISGWRKSLDDIAQFVFTDLGDSYAARTGRPRDVGVIGVAVFQESRPRHYPAYPSAAPPIARGQAREPERDDGYRRHGEAKSSAPAAAARESSAADSMAQQSMGTGHGAREWSPVGQTTFVRASRNPAQISQLRYDDAGRLMALASCRATILIGATENAMRRARFQRLRRRSALSLKQAPMRGYANSNGPAGPLFFAADSDKATSSGRARNSALRYAPGRDPSRNAPAAYRPSIRNYLRRP